MFSSCGRGIYHRSPVFTRILTKRTYCSATKSKETETKYEPGTTHFGFETVSENEKAAKVHKVFEEVSKSYDRMNDAMSMGIHRVWKDYFMEELAPTPGTKLLDMAGGTGDIAFRYLKYLHNKTKNVKDEDLKRSHLTISDINQHMLDVGKSRSEKLDYDFSRNCDVEWVCANAEELPFPDNNFTAYTIAFGIRNCTHIDKVLTEAYRVLKPGGRFLCLEFSQLEHEFMQKLYDTYSFQVIPPMGQILAGQWQPYQYLVESIRKFPKQEVFEDMIKSAGFSCTTFQNLSLGICAIHSGFKL